MVSNTNMVSGVRVQVSGKTGFRFHSFSDIFLKPDTRNLKPITPSFQGFEWLNKQNRHKTSLMWVIIR
jgi:hypothetical protein